MRRQSGQASHGYCRRNAVQKPSDFARRLLSVGTWIAARDDPEGHNFALLLSCSTSFVGLHGQAHRVEYQQSVRH